MPFSSIHNSYLARLFFSFGAIQAMQLLLPLLAFPWLGRVLGPEAFGILMYMCLFPQSIALVMEWGLTLGGARQATRERNCAKRQSTLLGAVFSAKIILATLCVLASMCAYPFVPYADMWPTAFFFAIMEGICRGWSPLWFFQGAGYGMKNMARWDVISSLCSLLLIFLCIRQSEQWQYYFLFCALCKGGAYGWLCLRLWRKFKVRLDFAAGVGILRSTCILFGNSFSTVVYTYGAQMVMGYFLPAAEMGIVAASGKILRAMGRLVTPLTQTVFPEICRHGAEYSGKIARILRFSIGIAFCGMCACVILVWIFAPEILKIALGKEYMAGAPILRIMVLAAPFMVFEQVLGTQILVPFGKEKAQFHVLISAAVASLALAASLSSCFGAIGAAWVPVCTGCFISGGLGITVATSCADVFFGKKGQ